MKKKFTILVKILLPRLILIPFVCQLYTGTLAHSVLDLKLYFKNSKFYKKVLPTLSLAEVCITITENFKGQKKCILSALSKYCATKLTIHSFLLRKSSFAY